MKWPLHRVSDFGRVITGKTPSTKNSNYWDGQFLFVTPSDLSFRHYYCSKTERCVSDEAKERFKNQVIPENSVMFTSIGNTIGKCAISSAESLTNQQINSIIVNEHNDFRFVYYLLCNNVETVKSLGASSATPIVNKTEFQQIRLKAPDLPEQQRIGDILSAYDSLIENNRRRIQLLEQSARMLYKEWFVHLRFPGHEHVKIKNGVPEGWERKTVGDVAEVLSGFAFKSSTFQSEGNFAIVTIKNVQDGQFDTVCSSSIDQPPKEMQDHCYLRTGDVLLSLTGNIGRVCMVHGDGFLLNQRVAKLQAKDVFTRSFVYCMFRNEGFQSLLTNLSYGVAQQNLSPVKMKSIELNVPPNRLIEDFTDVAEPLMDQILILNRENEKLRQARDILLPKLMSGKVEV